MADYILISALIFWGLLWYLRAGLIIYKLMTLHEEDWGRSNLAKALMILLWPIWVVMFT